MATIEIRDILNNETGETIFPRTHVDAIIGLKDFSFFEAVQDTQDPTKFSVKLKSEYTGLWADGWIAAGGIGSGSGGGGGGLIQTVYTWSDMQEMSNAPEDDTSSAFNAKTVYEIYKMLQSGGLDGGGYLKESGGGFFLTSSGEKILLKGEGHSLASLSDVSIYNPSVNDLLVWSGYSWVNVPQSSVRPDLSGYVTTATFNSTVAGLQEQIAAIENFFEIDGSGNVTLKSPYQNLWVSGWLAAGGIGTGSSGGSYTEGTGIDITNNVISLKTASSSVLGGVKVGTGLSIDANGVLSVTGGGGGGVSQIKIGSSTVSPDASGIAVITNPVLSLISGWFDENVTISQVLSSGTPIALVQIGNHPSYYLYAPSGGGGGGSDVSWGSSGSDYVYLSVDGTSKKLLTSHQDLSGYVTLATTQNNISGEKTFTTNPLHIGSTSGLDVNGDSYIDIGNARLVYDSGTNALHITKKSGTSATIGLYADGFVASGGISGQTTSSYVDLESAQTVGGNKTFTGTTALGQVSIGSIFINGSGTSPYINNTLDRIYIQRSGQTGISMCATAGQVVIGAASTSLSSKLHVEGDASFKYDSSHTISISNIVSRLEALE